MIDHIDFKSIYRNSVENLGLDKRSFNVPIGGIYESEPNNYILRPKEHWTHKDIVNYASFEIRHVLVEREQKEIRGEHMIDLETISFSEVPIGGVFIYKAAGDRDIAYHVYKKTVNDRYAQMIYSTRTGWFYEDYWFPFEGEWQVAYTGIILQG